jgi:hypothetical protein
MAKKKVVRKEGKLRCFQCGTSMKPSSMILGEISVRSWLCPKCGEEVLHPDDAQKALFINKMKKRGVKLKVGILNKAPYIRFPKAFLALLQKGDQVEIKVISSNEMRIKISHDQA